MTKQHDTTPAPTEPANPLPEPKTGPGFPAQPQSIGDGTGSTDAQPHCTPEEIADGRCVRG